MNEFSIYAHKRKRNQQYPHFFFEKKMETFLAKEATSAIVVGDEIIVLYPNNPRNITSADNRRRSICSPYSSKFLTNLMNWIMSNA